MDVSGENGSLSQVFTFDNSLQPTISSIALDSPQPPAAPLRVRRSAATSVTVAGENTITITGTGFGTDAEKVTVFLDGKDICKITSNSDTEIKCVVPPGSQGTKEVTVEVDGKGLSNPFEISYELDLQGISVNSGSMMGGTEITLTGNGLNVNNASLVSVMLGDYPAEVVSVADSIVAKTGPAALVVPIDNSAADNSKCFDSYIELSHLWRRLILESKFSHTPPLELMQNISYSNSIF